jgi:hypothetical protein
MGLTVICLVAWVMSLMVCLSAGGVALPPVPLAFVSLLVAFAMGSTVVGPVLLIARDRFGGAAWALPRAGIAIGVLLAAVLLFAFRRPLLQLDSFARTLYAAGGSFGLTFGTGLLIVPPKQRAARHQL